MLDLSRTLMYYFNYDYIKSNNDDKAKLLFTVRKSLVCEIETCDLYEAFYESKVISVLLSNESNLHNIQKIQSSIL